MSPLENTIDYRDKMSIKLCDHAHRSFVKLYNQVVMHFDSSLTLVSYQRFYPFKADSLPTSARTETVDVR